MPRAFSGLKFLFCIGNKMNATLNGSDATSHHEWIALIHPSIRVLLVLYSARVWNSIGKAFDYYVVAVHLQICLRTCE